MGVEEAAVRLRVTCQVWLAVLSTPRKKAESALTAMRRRCMELLEGADVGGRAKVVCMVMLA